MKTPAIIQHLIDSFKNTPGGFSARKLSAFAAVCIAGWMSIENANQNIVGELVITWLLFALLCLSIITVEQLVTLRTGWTSTKTIQSKKTETGSEESKQTTETTTEKKQVAPQPPVVPPTPTVPGQPEVPI